MAPGSEDEETRLLLEPLGELAGSNFFRTLVRHPRIYKRWMSYGHFLANGELPARDRELLVLRAAYRSASDYTWAHHVSLALDSGLTETEIDAVRGAADGGDWSASDATVLRAADELIDSHELSDQTWEALAARYDEHQLIEVPIVVGAYYTMGAALNTFGVELE